MRERKRPGYQAFPAWASTVPWTRRDPHLTAFELVKVVAWKSAKGLALVTENDERDIVERTKAAARSITAVRELQPDAREDETYWSEFEGAARAAIGDEKAGTGLLGLRGVGYPVATAVLCALDPNTWPVMDRWAVASVFDGVGPDWKHASAYRAFARHLATEGRRHFGESASIHELDVAAMNASMPGGQLPSGWVRATCPAR
jgi:hypothetical protein